MSLDELYRELIMDHYRRPRNRGELENATVTIALNNPLCGDEIELDLVLKDERVDAVVWHGRGCSISQASASMMTDAVKGKSVPDAIRLVANFKGMMRGEAVPDDLELGDLEALQGVAKFPVRIKCAVLPWEALRKGLQDRDGEETPVDL